MVDRGFDTGRAGSRLTELRKLRDDAYDVVVGHLHGLAPREESVEPLNRLARVELPAPQLRTDAADLPAAVASGGLPRPVPLSLIARDQSP